MIRMNYTRKNSEGHRPAEQIIRNTFYIQVAAFIISSLTTSIGTMIDGIIIGQFLGVESVAAYGIISPLTIAFAITGAVISAGARNRFTRLLGFGRIEDARRVFSLSCVLSVGFAMVLLPAILALATPITRILGASGNVAALLPKARDYLIGIAVGLPAMNAVRILSGYMPIDNDRRLPIIANIVLTVVDILLDLAVVFVLHGDTFEIGLATSLSYYAAAAVLLLHFRKKNILLRFSLRGLPWCETAGIVRQGLPNGVCRISNSLRGMFMNRLLGLIATSAAVAAYSVHRQADSFLNPITIGMADTAALMAGILMGEEDRPMIKRLHNSCLQATLLITVSVSVIVWFFAPQFAALYIKSDPEALRLSIRAVRCYALGMPLYGLNLIYMNYMQGIGKSRLASLTGFLMEGAFLVLAAGVLSHWVGADAVWYAFPVTQVLMVVYYGIIVAGQKRQPDRRFRGLGDYLLLLPPAFDVPEEDCLNLCITTMAEVSALSRSVWEFCRQHGCDKRRQLLLSLSVEEMVGNVIQHGFVDGKRHSIDVRILKKDQDYILRVRDDCMIFDPVNQLRLFSDQDMASHFGLRMIVKLAKEVRYTCVLKLNNLLIKV